MSSLFKSKSTSRVNNKTNTNQNTITNNSSLGASGSVSGRDPFAPASQGINSGLGMVTDWMGSPGAAATYGGPRVAGLSDGTQQGMSGLMNNQGYGTAQDLYQRTAQGDFLGGANPYMQQLQNSVSESVMPGINATFAGSGMTGSTIHQNQLAKGLGSAMAPHLFGAYETERNRQMQAAGALPGLYGQQARDQLTAGSIQDQQNQNILNSRMGAFNEARDRPMVMAGQGLAPLLQAGGMFGESYADNWQSQNNQGQTNMTGTSATKGTTTQSNNSSPFSQILGGTMMGLGAMSGMPGLGAGMAGMFGGGAQQPSYTPMTAASAGMMNAYSPYTNPFATGGQGYQMPQANPGFTPQYGSVF